MDQHYQCLIVWISLTQIPQTHENKSNPEIIITIFIFLDSNHPIPHPTRTYKNPKVPKNPPTKNTQHHGIPNKQHQKTP
jgi:hypothetical protein